MTSQLKLMKTLTSWI